MGYLDYAGLQHLWDKLKEKFAPKSHSHDDRYYTEVEMDGKLEKKSSTDHTHDLSELISALSIDSSTTLNDSVQIITQDTNTANQKYYRRSLSVLWNYIKSKADSVYSDIGHNHKIQNLEEYTTRVYDATIVRPADTVLASPQDKDGLATFRKLDKNDVGLENVDNTADKNKNVATAGIATTGVRDYNNANNIIKIGWSGADLDANTLVCVAGYTSDKKIHPASKDGVRSWLGLGDSAYKNTKSRSSKGSTDWTNNATDDAIVPTMSFMAYWDGAYNSNGTSNLSYCDRGRFGTIVTKNTEDYAVAGHTHNSIKDIGNNSSDTTFAYSKAGMNYGDYTWLAAWNGYELRAINKNQFATAGHTHTKSQITDFPASLKNPTALTIQTNGATAATYDGSAAKTVNITKGNIGLGNVDNTADADKSVKYATSAGSANGVIPEWSGSVDLNSSSWLAAWSSDGKKIKAMSTGIFATAGHTHNSVSDIGSGGTTTFAYSKSGMNYGDYTWLAGWNGYELRAINKNQFATAGQGVTASGSNYVRFGDGTQMCWGQQDIADTGTTITFAVAFSSIPAVVNSGTEDIDDVFFVHNITTTNFVADKKGWYSGNNTWIAIGRWK